MGSRTELAMVHIVYVLQKLHFFPYSNFFLQLHYLLRKGKLHAPSFFLIGRICFHNLHSLPQKKVTRLHDFFAHELHFSWVDL